jgi:hypothetical protein
MTPEEFVLWQYAMIDIFWPLMQIWIAVLIFAAFTMTTWLVAAHLIRGGLSRI